MLNTLKLLPLAWHTLLNSRIVYLTIPHFACVSNQELKLNLGKNKLIVSQKYALPTSLNNNSILTVNLVQKPWGHP